MKKSRVRIRNFTYIKQQEKNFKVILKYIYPSDYVDDIRKEIEDI